MKSLSVPLASLAWTPGDRTELSAVDVYAVLAGASFVIVLLTGLLAFWLNRRARRARRLERTPVPRPRLPAAVPVPAARLEATIDLDRHRSNGNGRAPAPAPVDANGEYALLRAAAARAATVAAQARNTTVEASSTLDTAERVYEEARRAHAESLASAPEPGPSAGAPPERQQVRGFETAEMRARHQYHVALAHARAARQAEYVADTAVRALGAEAVAAAAELAAEHDTGNGNGRTRRWRRQATGVAR